TLTLHGSRGLIYFVHQFKPKFDEHKLLDDPVMLKAVIAINHQVESLAPIINRPNILHLVSVSSTSTDVPIDTMVKRDGRTVYLFTVGMRNNSTTGDFTVKGLPAHATAEVIGEHRSIAVVNGRFEDHFSPYGVHIYRIAAQ
ncbi:MAG: hypothetical protein M1330_03630, partial [Armatimonadetes bacterium]|nr:hypothetical protein [Armatimonadota bacterium]